MLPAKADGRGLQLTGNPYEKDGVKLWESSIDGLEIGTRTVDGVEIKGYDEVVDLRKPCRALLKACVDNVDNPKTKEVCQKELSYTHCVKVDCLD